MQVLVTTGQKAANLVSIDKERHKFTAFWVTTYDDVCDWLLTLSDDVKLLLTNLERLKWYVLELNFFVQQPQGCVESSFDIVFDIVCAYFELMEE